MIDQIEKLEGMRTRGVLSDVQFEAAKNRMLGLDNHTVVLPQAGAPPSTLTAVTAPPRLRANRTGCRERSGSQQAPSSNAPAQQGLMCGKERCPIRPDPEDIQRWRDAADARRMNPCGTTDECGNERPHSWPAVDCEGNRIPVAPCSDGFEPCGGDPIALDSNYAMGMLADKQKEAQQQQAHTNARFRAAQTPTTSPGCPMKGPINFFDIEPGMMSNLVMGPCWNLVAGSMPMPELPSTRIYKPMAMLGVGAKHCGGALGITCDLILPPGWGDLFPVCCTDGLCYKSKKDCCMASGRCSNLKGRLTPQSGCPETQDSGGGQQQLRFRSAVAPGALSGQAGSAVAPGFNQMGKGGTATLANGQTVSRPCSPCRGCDRSLLADPLDPCRGGVPDCKTGRMPLTEMSGMGPDPWPDQIERWKKEEQERKRRA